MNRCTTGIMLVVACFASILVAQPVLAEGDSPAKAAGLSLQALPSETLDAIQQETGYRVGVLVTQVADGSVAAKGGIKANDILLVIGNSGVDSPQAVDTALAGKSGDLQVLAMRRTDQGNFETVTTVLTISGQAAAPTDAAPSSPPPAAAPADIQEKLKALDAAHDAGVISDEEYAKKKAELEAQAKPAAPAIDKATSEKLAALDQAHKAGVLSDDEHARKKAQLLGPAGAQAPVSAPDRKPGKTYRHAVGFSFWLAAGWTVKEQEGFLQVTPPNQFTSPEGPTELYFITEETVAGTGIERPDDPRVAEYFDQQVKTLAPTLRRTGQPTSIDTAKGKGVVLTWEGKSPKGDVVMGRAYANIIDAHGVALLAIGFKPRITARDAELRQMFASFGFGQGDVDQALVGTWSLTSEYALSNNSPFETSDSKARMASEKKSTLVLRADGTWTRNDQFEMIAMGAGVSLESKDQKSSKGRWNAGAGVLYMMWDDESYQNYKYQIRQAGNGRELRLATGQKGQIWTESGGEGE